MLLVFQLNDFLAFITDFGESKPDLHSTVIYILRKSRTQGLINIFSDFSNYGCLVAHSCLRAHGQRRSISFMISSAQRIASAMARSLPGLALHCRTERASLQLECWPQSRARACVPHPRSSV